MSVLDRARTPYDEKIYSGEWRSWRDPEIPEWIDPIGVLFGRHRGTLVDSKPAIIADGRSVTYARADEAHRAILRGPCLDRA